MFRLLLRTSSGWCYCLFRLLIISPWRWPYYRPKHVGKNIVSKTHHKQWSVLLVVCILYYRIARFYFVLPQKSSRVQIVWFENGGYVRQQLTPAKFFSSNLNTKNMKSRSHVTNRQFFSIKWKNFPEIIHWPNCATG